MMKYEQKSTIENYNKIHTEEGARNMKKNKTRQMRHKEGNIPTEMTWNVRNWGSN